MMINKNDFDDDATTNLKVNNLHEKVHLNSRAGNLMS